MSGRASSMKMALPMNTRACPPHAPGVVGSDAGTGSRQIATLVTSRSSAAQPVTATEPAATVPLAGVSIAPMGALVLLNPVTATAIARAFDGLVQDWIVISALVVPPGK